VNSGDKLQTHSHFLQNSVTDIGLDLLDLFEGCCLVETPDEKIYVAGRCKLLVIILSEGQESAYGENDFVRPSLAYRSAFLEVLYLSGTGSSAVTTALPAATTLVQSRSASEDSEKRLKFFLNSCKDSTFASAPSCFRSLICNGIMYLSLRAWSSAPLEQTRSISLSLSNIEIALTLGS